MNNITTNWKQSNIQQFWGEIASEDHLLQIYDNEPAFLNSLEGFAGSGFLAKQSVIIIATETHAKVLNSRLTTQGFDINKLIAEDQYIVLDAEELLQNFMVNGMPEEKRFMKLAAGIVHRAKKAGRKVRAFGEMVAILFAEKNIEATIALEALWNKFCSKENICLFCAYPKKGLGGQQLERICCEHSKIISGATGPSTQVLYKSVSKETAKVDG